MHSIGVKYPLAIELRSSNSTRILLYTNLKNMRSCLVYMWKFIFLHRLLNHSSVCDFPWQGAVRKTTQWQDALIQKMLVADGNKNAAEICKEMAFEHKLIMVRDIIKCLNAVGFCIQIPARKPLIQAKNGKIRLKFTREHKTWAPEIRRRSFEKMNLNSICLEVMVNVIFIVQTALKWIIGTNVQQYSSETNHKWSGAHSIIMVASSTYTPVSWLKMFINSL